MMKSHKKMDLKSRYNSIACAVNGFVHMIKHEPNARIHAVATVAVVIAGFVRHIHTQQWIAIVFAIALVWITEALNTCIERLCDHVCGKEWHPEIKIIKDIAATAVWIAAIISIAIGVLVFLF